jgi:MFS family permease
MSEAVAPRLTRTQWLIVIIAALGFAFDIYELLVWPLVGRPALERLLGVDQFTVSGDEAIRTWFSYIMYASAICGGVFGLLGGYLTDWFGRRRVLTYSILLYAFSALASGFATSPEMLLILRCTTFIGVCVEFVAATAWLAELFTHPRQRETILGYTQAFSSFGGLMVSGAYWLCNHYRESLPAIYDAHDAWRYTLISGVLPAIPLMIIRPFLPESPGWLAKRQAGTLTRPSFTELFSPHLLKVTIVSTLLMMCVYGIAFGAVQLTPQIVPGLVEGAAENGKQIGALRKQIEQAKTREEAAPLRKRLGELTQPVQATVARVQMVQELGGLAGRFALAYAAVVVISRRKLLRLFVIPGLLITPIVFLYCGTGKAGSESLTYMQIGIFLVGFFTIAQMSFWGNYLPRVFPLRLRGTGESFAANVGGRFLGTGGFPRSLVIVLPFLNTHHADMLQGLLPQQRIAVAAGIVGLAFYLLAFVMTFFLPEPPARAEHD